MLKIINKVLLLILTILTILFSYLTFVGIKTDSFNYLISENIKKIDNNLNIELNKVFLKLNPSDLSISIVTENPKLFTGKINLKIQKIKTEFSVFSYIKNEPSIKSINLKSDDNNIKSVIKYIRLFKDNFRMMLASKFVQDGIIQTNMNFNFDKQGKIKNDYLIEGYVNNLKINSTENKLLSNFKFTLLYNQYSIINSNTKFNNYLLESELIIIKKTNKKNYFVEGDIKTLESNILTKDLENFFSLTKYLKNKDLKISTSNKFKFNINDKLKIKKFNLISKLIIPDLDLNLVNNKLDNTLVIKNFIKLTNNNINLKLEGNPKNIKEAKFKLNGNSNILIDGKNDEIIYEIIQENGIKKIKTKIGLINNQINIDLFNFITKTNLDSFIKLDFEILKDKTFKFKEINLENGNNRFISKNLKLNNKLDLLDLESVNFEFKNNHGLNNKIQISKIKNNFIIKGELLDGTSLLSKFLNEDKDKVNILKEKKTKIIVKIKKLYLNKKDYVNNLSGDITFRKGEIFDLDLLSYFPNKEALIFNIKLNSAGNKVTTLTTNFPKPLISRYEFIQGFEEGVLDLQTISRNDISKSTLVIDNFKVKKIPVLAKILTLASLQGIADLLTGEGIRFTDFEMKSSKVNNLTTIEEIYAIGPAISLMMDGYIKKNEVVSLRGTLVPATTINRTISSIPLIGDILVGKKVGEGVFGVSFKIKGHPDNLKTTVNPIKTLTPRFITRTLEKIKN